MQSHAQRWNSVLAAAWIVAVIVVSIQAAVLQNDNFEIFRTSWLDLRAGRDLYELTPRRHHADFFLYSPAFALLFAPFAILPFGVGLLLWNAVNAGTLYWSLGRALPLEQAFAARSIVFLEAIGSMQNAQSNALIAGLIVLTYAHLDRRQELRAALVITLAMVVKIFPLAAAAFAIFRPARVPRFAAFVVAGVFLAAASPLVLLSTAELAAQYDSWAGVLRADSLQRGFSVMQQLHLWLGVSWPNWPVQLAGIAVLLAPLARASRWSDARFRLLFVASVLMFCVLFNHASESPTFVIAIAGVALWFVTSAFDRRAWGVLAIVALITVVSPSAAIPEFIQKELFEPYRLRTLPVLLVWVLTQVELWRRIEPTAHPALRAAHAAPAT